MSDLELYTYNLSVMLDVCVPVALQAIVSWVLLHGRDELVGFANSTRMMSPLISLDETWTVFYSLANFQRRETSTALRSAHARTDSYRNSADEGEEHHGPNHDAD